MNSLSWVWHSTLWRALAFSRAGLSYKTKGCREWQHRAHALNKSLGAWVTYFYGDLSQPPTTPIKSSTSREKKDIHVSQNACDGSYQFGDWMLFPCEHLHPSYPGCHMDIKGKHIYLEEDLEFEDDSEILTPRSPLQPHWGPANKTPSVLIPVPLHQEAPRGHSHLCLVQNTKKAFAPFHLLTCPTYNPWFWHPSAEAGEGNDATEPGGPHASQYKNSHSCMNDSMGVSRSLVISNTQPKTVTSTGLRRYLCDVGAIESSYQKSLWSQRGCQKGRVLAQKRHGHSVISTLNPLCPWSQHWVNLNRTFWQVFAIGYLMVFLLNPDTTNAELLDLFIVSALYPLDQHWIIMCLLNSPIISKF